ncbi:MAG: class I tRNA ligase family protein, partial [Thaumarchaeota archaeon]|nr:class I tRNA ligase family protein [Nitrososphaerota archaeon]
MKDRAIITSALPYANGEIHLGHVASTYLPADITTRFLKMNDVEAYYICASDDFGTPILIQSEKEGKTPAEYVSYWNKRDHEDFGSLDIDFDYFYRTSSPENIAFVQDVFKKLHAAGYIYEKEIIQ